MSDDLLERFRQGDRAALSRLVTLAGQPKSDVLLDRLPSTVTAPRVVAFTGSGGVGKSTLVGKLLPLLREKGLRVAVLACDPQSPLTGGALLGDRFRMGSTIDDGLFIRSLATPGGQGALAPNLPRMIKVLAAFGFQWILLETVGAGQGDTAVREVADTLVLLVQPEAGDDIQWEKAGIFEVADVIVVHKADLPGTDETDAQLRDTFALSTAKTPAIIAVSSKTAQGLEELYNLLAAVSDAS